MRSPASSQAGRKQSKASSGARRSGSRSACTRLLWTSPSPSASPTGSVSRCSTGTATLRSTARSSSSSATCWHSGEVLLGYPNEYGLLHRSSVAQSRGGSQGDDIAAAPRTFPAGAISDGTAPISYCESFSRTSAASGSSSTDTQRACRRAGTRWRAAMVGRTRQGAPLVPLASAPIPGIASPAPGDIATNQFTYVSDPDGVRCPLGAHIRRANPRTADLPGGRQGWLSRLLRMLGFKRAGVREDLVASTRFHRLLRRGRKYGEPLSLEEALRPGRSERSRAGCISSAWSRTSRANSSSCRTRG